MSKHRVGIQHFDPYDDIGKEYIVWMVTSGFIKGKVWQPHTKTRLN